MQNLPIVTPTPVPATAGGFSNSPFAFEQIPLNNVNVPQVELPNTVALYYGHFQQGYDLMGRYLARTAENQTMLTIYWIFFAVMIVAFFIRIMIVLYVTIGGKASTLSGGERVYGEGWDDDISVKRKGKNDQRGEIGADGELVVPDNSFRSSRNNRTRASAQANNTRRDRILSAERRIAANTRRRRRDLPRLPTVGRTGIRRGRINIVD
ncbi:MAG: hypothetical protein ACOYL5_16525 [Phototrophicaceae bacterium]